MPKKLAIFSAFFTFGPIEVIRVAIFSQVFGLHRVARARTNTLVLAEMHFECNLATKMTS